MQWSACFRAALFERWRASGLPEPSAYTVRQREICGAIALPPDLLAGATASPGPMAVPTLTDVFRFGAFIGQSLGRLQGLPAAHVAARAEWCGRFNLGISLFDYVADEIGRIDDLLTMAPFVGLSPAAGSAQAGGATGRDLGPEARRVAAIAADVMRELETAVGPSDRRPHADALWRSLREMMAAESLMSRATLGAHADIEALRSASMIKSAGPFRCMSEWLAVGARRPRISRESAAALGAALGALFWMVDDALDLWEDLDARRWNLFLLESKRVEPELFGSGPDDLTELRLSRILLKRGWVQSIIAPMIEQFAAVVACMPAEPSVRQEVSGLVAATMERWLG